ncbi:MAG: hypothetical protein ACD_37C00050G0002 [uncultured bacterium]|nr:MAG: hypothetical protein ACD_37C00050G0002 [uncultured bacterium]KKR17586.1 MAG: hypothetical protein UT44_C0006G0013 [Candidatus Levybacteria bacterium GW2011_GWA1_39_32]KKR51476.1 MAG: hypothetical protein UT87_C0005G0012 [Candidatus Levybacteria bacterium GW2011_GWC1_40_19]KKR73571.1 MAG: hypothetical protein UU15_C0007G0017 [Candidatus Levybacteria bacterium GW2011_GWC2_40_7]KKR95459.1 MAG: hypothetical protein UU45_C0001G0054 [Candidatus Levybacteria bacterium GW2011_GWA2_41_15]KKS019
MNLASVLNFFQVKIAYAHCDIPCGIYDPHNAQLAAHTIIRMTQLLGEVKPVRQAQGKREDETKAEHDIARITHVKEEHASLLENELTTLQNDYFKEEHIKEYPSLPELFKNASRLGAKARQGIDTDSAQKLLLVVQDIAEIFFKTKGVIPVRVKSVYPTGGEIVTYK